MKKIQDIHNETLAIREKRYFNLHSREIIQQSSLSNTELAERFRINEKTVSSG
jgi:DNA-binding CsgD family transcriptional regulator